NITEAMIGRSWMIWSGVVSGQWDERASGMRKRSTAGGECAGPPLKKTQKEGRTIIFIDESGISQRPHRVPVNEVAEPTLVQNIVTMFQIHKLRKDWELMPTAIKLELLMRELGERKEKRLAELTGLDEAVVVRCKKLLSYNKKYQDMMLDADP